MNHFPVSLQRINREPTIETVARQEQISFWVLLPVCLTPPIALLYGYGYMDGVASDATISEVNEGDVWRKGLPSAGDMEPLER